jgi:hypothetical protein
MRKLGPKKSLTQLNIHHWASEIVRSEEYGHRDHAGLPSQMFRYALGLVTTISNKTTDDDNLSYFDLVNELRSISASYTAKDAEEHPETGIDPWASDEQVIRSAVRDRELLASRQAYDSQYIDAMRRSYTPFQTEFLEHRGIDMSKSIEYATQLLDIFSDRIEEICHDIRRYQTECLRILVHTMNGRRGARTHPPLLSSKLDVIEN